MSAHLGERLSEWLDGRLDVRAAAAVSRHLEECDHCRSEAEALRAVRVLLREAEPPAPSATLWRHLERRMAAERARQARRQLWRRGIAPAAAAAFAVALAALPAPETPASIDHYLHEHTRYRALHPLTDSALITLVSTDAMLRALRGAAETQP